MSHLNLFRDEGQLVPYEPLGVSDFRALSQNPDLEALSDEILERLWLKPVQRKLQNQFRIDQRNYNTGTNPTLAELDEDFAIAATITIDKMATNVDDVSGPERVLGAFRFWSHRVPERASALLERYRGGGGGGMIARA